MEVDAKSKFCDDWHIIGLHKFDEVAVGVFDVGEMSRCAAHVEYLRFRFVCLGVGVGGEGTAFGFAILFEFLHIADVVANLDESRVAPEVRLKVVNLARLTLGSVDELDELYLALVEEVAERAFALLRVTEKDAAELVVAAVDACKIFKDIGLVVEYGVVAEDVFVKVNRPVHIRYTDNCAVHTADFGFGLAECDVALYYFKEVAEWVFHKEVILAREVFAETGEQQLGCFALEI